jgi:hypothetical protein
MCARGHDRYRHLTGAESGAPLDLAGNLTLPRGFDDCDFVYCCYSRAIPGGEQLSCYRDAMHNIILDHIAGNLTHPQGFDNFS